MKMTDKISERKCQDCGIEPAKYKCKFCFQLCCESCSKTHTCLSNIKDEIFEKLEKC